MNLGKSDRLQSSATVNSLRILETIARFGPSTTAKDIVDALSMPPATAYRLLNALVGDEYLVRSPDLRGFALGHSISGLIAAGAMPIVPTAARNLLEEFRGKTRFGVHLIAFQPASLKIVDSDPDHPLRSEAELMRYLHASAAGKLFLSQLEVLSTFLTDGRLKKLTAKTLTDVGPLKEELEQIRRRGYAMQVDELEEGMCCLAYPVALPGSPAGGSLCIAGASERLEAIKAQTASALQAANQLAPLLF
ncbi:IclR family transcriptional regulator [Paenarthrobacter aurescens]|uniref:Transcriptional regulator, IclR family n=1 Tax=Paenarthrobacter aurescens (strain TC1) TaxID=290340 RepID=A1RDN6_PAEAT|nr:IclR family transcriptional regulator C-terminal domain-containing protein [Paenarthrobacter aurescens]ABM10774.1 transcriptional regulator, IclR family [Paenarthrobacter aurescens TC1]